MPICMCFTLLTFLITLLTLLIIERAKKLILDFGIKDWLQATRQYQHFPQQQQQQEKAKCLESGSYLSLPFFYSQTRFPGRWPATRRRTCLWFKETVGRIYWWSKERRRMCWLWAVAARRRRNTTTIHKSIPMAVAISYIQHWYNPLIGQII